MNNANDGAKHKNNANEAETQEQCKGGAKHSILTNEVAKHKNNANKAAK